MDQARISWRGRFGVAILDPDGEVISRETFPNLITDSGLNYLAGLLADSGAPITHIALGDGAAAPAPTDARLANERFRKQVTRQELLGTGEMRTTLYVASYEANFFIQEIGVFAGATDVKDSGILIARVLWSHIKNELESLQIMRTDTLARA